MDVRQLRNFLKIAELGSISRAADVLGVAQPSLSQQVLRLEDEVGFKLFQRTTRGVVVTEAGEILQRHAVRMLEIAEQAVDEMRQVREEARAKVAVAMPFSISRLLAVQLTEAVMEEAPGVSLRLREGFSGAVRAMLQEGSVDIGLLFDDEPLEQFTVKRLARDEIYLIGPPGRLAGIDSAERFVMSEVLRLPLIVPGPTHALRVTLDQEAHRHGLRLKAASEIDSLDRIVGLVADGRGYSILPLSAARSELRAGAISAARIEGSPGGTLFLARRADAPVSDPSRRIEQLLIRLLGGLMEKGQWLAAPADVDRRANAG